MKSLQNSQVELQKYAVTVGRISKLYGVSDAALASISKTLTQQFNISIEKAGELLNHGAEVANAANINVGKFFENLQGIANLQGKLFIKGGAEGLERAAFALTKLGLTAESVSRVADSVKDFGQIMEEQNKAAALGLGAYSESLARIFAKNWTGSAAEALNLKLASLAEDVQRHVVKGQLNQSGIFKLQNAGLNEEEIKAVQRLINLQKELGASFHDVINETNLSNVQLEKKRKIEQENMKITERLSIIWKKIQASIIDPIASVLGPLVDMVIDFVDVFASIISTVLKPIGIALQVFGNALTKVAGTFKVAAIKVDEFLKKIGIGNSDGPESLKASIDKWGGWLEKIFYVILAWKSISLVRSGVGAIGDLLKWLPGTGLMAGKSGKILKGLGKVGVIGSAAAIGGNMAGEAIGGIAGDNLSAAASGAGIGATVGSIVPVIGTAIGAVLGGLIGLIYENWDSLVNSIKEIWNGLPDIVQEVLQLMNPISAFNMGWQKMVDWWEKDKQDKQTQDAVKIASSSSAIGNVAAEQVSAIMQGREVYKSREVQAMEIKELERQKQAQTLVNVNIKQDLFGQYSMLGRGF
jgi:hypothetical protein